MLTIRAETGKALEKEADVFVFAQDKLLQASTTRNGFYGAALPGGAYAVAIVYPSTPNTGSIKQNVTIKKGETTAATFVLPADGNLKVLVRAKNDAAPQKSYSVTIGSGGREVTRSSGRSEPMGFRLSTGFAYDVAVKYGEEDFKVTGVKLKSDEDEEVKLTLPFNETDLAVLLYTKNGGAPRKSFNAVVSYRGTTVASASSAKERFLAETLRDDRPYVVTVEYEGQKFQQTGVMLKEGTVTEQSFNLPWDEGVLAVLVRVGDKVQSANSAGITVLDAAGREVASQWTTDRYTVVLHTEKEYTVRVQYKNQPEQQRKVLVSADKLTEETFNFAQ